MRRIKIALCIAIVLDIFIITFLGVNPISGNNAANIVFTLSIGLIVFILSVSVLLGPLGPLFVRQNLERIGLVNRKGEAPLLLRIRASDKYENGFCLIFEDRGIAKEEWEKNRDAIEAALNIFILRISDGDTRRHIEIDAVWAKYRIPDFVEWRDEYLPQGDFTLRLGVGLHGPVDIDLAVIPHVLIGGATGSGKSLLLRLLLAECLSKNAAVFLADFQGGLSYLHFRHPNFHLITDMDSFIDVLEKYVNEMETRIKILTNANTPNLKEYNEKNPLHQHKRIIIACDEAAAVLDKTGLPKDDKERIDRANKSLSALATRGRSVGLHLFISVQRPSADILTGQVKSNLTYRICGRADLVLSQIILDNGNANDAIPKDAQGRFIMDDGTVFQGYWSDI